MNMNTNSTIQNTARLGVCLLIGAAAFAACGQVKEEQASSSPVVAPAASTIQSSVTFDRQASLELASGHALEAAARSLPVGRRRSHRHDEADGLRVSG